MLSAYNCAGRRYERMKNIELRSCAFDQLAVTLNRSRPGVKDQVINREERTSKARGLTSSQYGADSCQELNRRKRLGKVVIRACFESSDLVGYCRPRGQHDHWDTALLPNLVQNAEAVAIRQHDIENDQYKPAFCGSVQACFCCVGEGDCVSFRAEILGEHFRHVLVIVDKEDLTLRSVCGAKNGES